MILTDIFVSVILFIVLIPSIQKGGAVNIAYIMRGVSGSGKSTLAERLAGDSGVIHSADDFFMVDGCYSYDVSRLAEIHDRNFSAFCCSLDEGIPVVVCDNTNSKLWNFDRYIYAAKERGYRVAIVMLPHPDPEVAASRSVHRVPVHVIREMIERWEY